MKGQIREDLVLEISLQDFDIVLLRQGDVLKTKVEKPLKHFNLPVENNLAIFDLEFGITHYSSRTPGLYYKFREENQATKLFFGIKPPYQVDDLANEKIEVKELKEKYKIPYVSFSFL